MQALYRAFQDALQDAVQDAAFQDAVQDALQDAVQEVGPVFPLSHAYTFLEDTTAHLANSART